MILSGVRTTKNTLKIHYEPPKTVCKTPFASIFPPSMENGDGTRFYKQPQAAGIDDVAFECKKVERRCADFSVQFGAWIKVAQVFIAWKSTR